MTHLLLVNVGWRNTCAWHLPPDCPPLASPQRTLLRATVIQIDYPGSSLSLQQPNPPPPPRKMKSYYSPDMTTGTRPGERCSCQEPDSEWTRRVLFLSSILEESSYIKGRGESLWEFKAMKLFYDRFPSWEVTNYDISEVADSCFVLPASAAIMTSKPLSHLLQLHILLWKGHPDAFWMYWHFNMSR